MSFRHAVEAPERDRCMSTTWQSEVLRDAKDLGSCDRWCCFRQRGFWAGDLRLLRYEVKKLDERDK